jgi:hypothetical protein
MAHRFFTSLSLGQGCLLVQLAISSASADAATACSSLSANKQPNSHIISHLARVGGMQ